jgi:hypothetical protein
VANGSESATIGCRQKPKPYLDYRFLLWSGELKKPKNKNRQNK